MKIIIPIIAAAAIILSGCATNYTYQGKTYTSRVQADAARQRFLDGMLEKVTPREKSLATFAKLIIPKKQLTYDRGTKGSNLEARDFVANHLYDDYRNTLRMIEKRNIFAKTEFMESDGDHPVLKDGEIIIYMYLPDNQSASWYYVSKNVKRTPLNFDRGNPDKFMQVYFLIESVEALAASESE